MARDRPTPPSPSGPSRDRTRRAVPAVAITAVVLGIAALAAWEATLTRQSSAAHWSVGAVLAVMVGGALVGGRGHQHMSSRAWLGGAAAGASGWRRRPRTHVAGVAVWAALIAAVAGWDLYSFARQAHDLPTLSYFVGQVTAVPAGRGMLFAGWAVLGIYLAAGRRQPR